MAKPRKGKSGKPRALELVQDNNNDDQPKQTPEEFAKDFFPGEKGPTGEEVGTSLAIPQPGLPSLSELKSKFKTKSAAIRYLTFLGHKPKEIAKHLGIRYQHARNVATTELKRGPNEDWRPPEMIAKAEPTE